MRRLFQDAGSYYNGFFTIHISGKNHFSYHSEIYRLMFQVVIY